MSLSADYRGTTWHRELPARSAVWSQGGSLVLSWYAWPLGLYLLTLALNLWNIGGHPDYAYNWESYTARDTLAFWDAPSLAIFRPTDGLMTNSGTSPLIALPIWLAFKIGGVSLLALRLPITLIASLTVPLLWLVGRRLAGTPVATLAALFLALTPSYLLYARTATLVGLSVVFALATVLVALRVLQRPTSWWALLGLQALLCVNTYGYAPLRFLWPISAALISWELLRRWREWRWFLPALLLTLVALPLFVVVADRGLHTPHMALLHYYSAGGEQIRQMNASPDLYGTFLHTTPTRSVDGTYEASNAELALALIGQNSRDFANLLLDRDTETAIVDYWNPQGRLYALILVPFFFLGLGRALWRLWWHLEDRVLLAHFFGFGLPMLLTSRVHIGRLVFFLPFLLLLVASGVQLVASWLFAAGRLLLPALVGTGRTATVRQPFLLVVLAAPLALGVGWSAWQDYRVAPGPQRESRAIEDFLAALPEVQARGSGLVLFVDDGTQREIEELGVGVYRLALYNHYRFVDLLADDANTAADGTLPVFYYGNPQAHRGRPMDLPDTCANIYFVAPALEQQFAPTIARFQETCGQPPDYHLLRE